MPDTVTDEQRELRNQYLEQLAHIWQSRKEGRITAGVRLALSNEILDKMNALDIDTNVRCPSEHIALERGKYGCCQLEDHVGKHYALDQWGNVITWL